MKIGALYTAASTFATRALHRMPKSQCVFGPTCERILRKKNPEITALVVVKPETKALVVVKEKLPPPAALKPPIDPLRVKPRPPEEHSPLPELFWACMN
jgi:hypothetical protein